MNLQVTESAADWYKDELQLQEGEMLRFYVRYGGVGGQIPGFSLALSTDKKQSPLAETSVKGITFFIESEDSWYFDGADLQIELDDKSEEPSFTYQS